MNPIIEAIPGIPVLVLVEMEYYHTSSDDEVVEGIIDDPGEVILDHVVNEPPADEQERVDDREEIENGDEGGISYQKPSSPTEEEHEEDVVEKQIEDDRVLVSKKKPSIKSVESRKQHVPILMDNILKIEADHQAVKPVKLELQKDDAQSFMSATQELISKIQLLTQHLEKINSDVKQIPGLISEFEHQKELYDQFSATYDHGEKLENDHLESLQMMEQNYVSMAREVEKLQAELANTADLERRTEPRMRGLMDKIGKIEVDHQAKEPDKLELQKADAQSFKAATEELIAKIQQLTQHLEKINSDVKQIPGLISEFEHLKELYDQFRATYDHENKVEKDHLESLQMMQKNYISMAGEVEKLQAADFESRAGSGSVTGYKENEAAGHHSVGQNADEDDCSIPSTALDCGKDRDKLS